MGRKTTARAWPESKYQTKEHGNKNAMTLGNRCFWIQRTVEDQAAQELELAAERIGGVGKLQLAGKFTLTLLYHDEVYKKFKRPRLTAEKAQELSRALYETWPDSLDHPTTARIKEFRTYGRWIGLAVDYEQFFEERKTFTTVIDNFLDYQPNWRPGDAHISITPEYMSCLNSARRIKRSLPKEIHLLPAGSPFTPAETVQTKTDFPLHLPWSLPAIYELPPRHPAEVRSHKQ